MSGRENNDARGVSDETLVAYLDGSLPEGERRRVDQIVQKDEAVRERLNALDMEAAPLKGAFDALLQEAPTERLKARFEAASRQTAAVPGFESPSSLGLHPSPAPSHSTAVAHPFSGWRMAAGLSAAALLIGLGLGVYLERIIADRENLAVLEQMPGETAAPEEPATEQTPPPPAEPARRGWIAAVADYIVLYGPETLAALASDPGTVRNEFAAVTSALNARLTVEDAVIPGTTLRQARLLNFNGRPLAQIMLADDEGRPFALCVIPTQMPDRGAVATAPNGLPAVNWIENGFHYVVIGDLPEDEIKAIATEIAARTG